MTDDELLPKMLDNTLTETERLELHARMAASPYFAEEIREYLAVEEMLTKTKVSLTSAPASLLQSVEQKTAATIIAAAATTAVPETAVRSALSGRLLTAISALVIGGAATWYFVTSNTPITEPIAEQQHNQQAPEVLHTPNYSPKPQQQKEQVEPERISVERSERNVDNTAQPQQRVTEVQAAVPPQSPITDAPTNMDARKNDKDNASKQLSQQLDAYKTYKDNGNTINLMITAKKIGIVYRTLKEFDNSRVYLEEALLLARAQHVSDEEAIITGEMGLLEKERGNLEQAQQLLQNCVDSLRTLGSPQLQRWQDELTGLRKVTTDK